MNVQLKSSARFKNILLVNRTPKFAKKTQQMVAEGFFFSKILFSEQQQQMKMHTSCLRNLRRIFYEYDFNCEVVQDTELTKEHAEGKDLIIAFGNDSTLLRAHSSIHDYNLPILGISTSTEEMDDSTLQDNHFIYMKRREHSRRIAQALMNPNQLDYSQRSRIKMNLTTVDKGTLEHEEEPDQDTSHQMNIKEWLILNEALMAEADVASASRYRIQPDERDLGMFKSSGLIVSTGTGSTGWLYNARQISSHKVFYMQKQLGNEYHSRNLHSNFARKWNNDTVFSPQARDMFFFVREGFSLTQLTEGYCKHLKVTSEMIKGEVVVDGWAHTALGMGDVLTLDVTDPKNDLTMLHLNLD